jgi:hypothetical protein
MAANPVSPSNTGEDPTPSYGRTGTTTTAPVTIRHADGETKVVLDQKKKPAVDGLLQPVGTFRCTKGKAGYVEIANAGTEGYVVIDAVQWLEAKP